MIVSIELGVFIMIRGVVITNKSGVPLVFYQVSGAVIDEKYLNYISSLSKANISFKSVVIDEFKIVASWGRLVNVFVFIDPIDLEDEYIGIATGLNDLFEKLYKGYAEDIKTGKGDFTGFADQIKREIETFSGIREKLEFVVDPIDIVAKVGDEIEVNYIFHIKGEFPASCTLILKEIRDAFDQNLMEERNLPGLSMGNTIIFNKNLETPLTRFNATYRARRAGKQEIHPVAIIQICGEKELRIWPRRSIIITIGTSDQ